MSVTARSQRVIAHYGLVLGISLLVVGALLIGGAWFVFSNPPTEQVTERINQQEIRTNSQTRAVVTGTNQTLYERGTVLEQQSVYLYAASPNLTIQTTVRVPRDLAVTVEQRLVLELSASREEQVFWRLQRLLGHTDEQVRDGDSTLNATANVSDIRATVAQKRGEIGDIGTFRTAVNLTVSYDTGKYSGEITAQSPLTLLEQGYWLASELSDSRTHSETVTRQETGSPNMGQVYLFGGIGTGLVLAGLLLAFYYFRVPAIEQLETRIARSRFEEWISNGEIPTKAQKEYVRIESLEDLVDIAIDQNKRVIFDDNYDAYAVIEGDLVYYFATGERAFDDWLEV